jgi:hypothetical protein
MEKEKGTEDGKTWLKMRFPPPKMSQNFFTIVIYALPV